MGVVTFSWTDEAVDALRRMWVTNLRVPEIALILDPTGALSRNAVIGKAHRIGLRGTRPASSGGRPASSKPKKARAPRSTQPRRKRSYFVINNYLAEEDKPLPFAGVEEVGAAPDSVGATLLDLEDNMCRWVIDDAAGIFCGAQVAGPRGKPYCAYHARAGSAGIPVLRPRRPSVWRSRKNYD